jgi:hydroxyacylglutathione hydrolase
MRLTEHIHIVASGMYGFDLTHPSDCHVYLIDGGTELALIDAGAGIGTTSLLTRLRATGRPLDRVRKLFVTHAHADHAGGAGPLHRSLGLDVLASPEVAAILRAGDEHGAGVDIGKKQGTYDRSYRYEPTPIAGELHGGDRVAVGEVDVEVIETPGHSAGHLAFLIRTPERADLFTGDTLFHGGEIILQNTWDCDLRAHLESLRRLGQYRFDGLFPGHASFSVNRGRRHLDVALAALDRGGIPPLFY